ncbi:ABC transporter permease [Olivibacter ginsenosidimutans]|uniref:ABC transporter permease n=1 Tax=Olivibacter ginsenosidimutans TaxID=1176537 RepID=A0ABP9C149_9SPHI
MLKNYFKTAFRTLKKNKSYSVIAIVGLSISLSTTMLISLWVWDELSFDQMHSKGNRIYKTATLFGDNKEDAWSATSAPVAVFGKAEIPTIEEACRINEWGGDMLLQYGDKKFNETATYVDASYFNMFDFKLIQGNPASPFPDNQSIILSQSLAKKYFGTADPIGKTLIDKDQKTYKVSGVMADMPKNSSMQYTLLLPFDILVKNYKNTGGWGSLNTDWGNASYVTYFLLNAKTNIADTEQKLTATLKKYIKDDWAKNASFLLQPLRHVHLYHPGGSENGMKEVKIFMLVAFIILLISCINYTNLVTARASRRGKEVSMRKIVGASKQQLFWQFLHESFLVFAIAALLAIAFVALAMPFYNQLSGKEMVFSLSDTHVWVLFGSTLAATMILAGIYPAITLSSFKPALALKGIYAVLGNSGNFRKLLVVVQFVCAVILIIATLIISKQLSYVRHKNLGYDKENVFSINQRNFNKRYEAIKQALQSQTGIQGVTACNSDINNISYTISPAKWEGQPANLSNFGVKILYADPDFFNVMNIKLQAGKAFSGTAADSSHYILNETAIKQMQIVNPIGKTFTLNGTSGIIIGVVKDFHFKSMKTAIEPLVIQSVEPSKWWNMYIKTTGHQAHQALAAVERLWKQYNPDYAFDYQFIDQSFDNLYKTEIRSGKLFNIFAGMAILLSCLGLFGLVTYTAETKVREIGIRKTLGANISHIILLLSKDFLGLVGMSFIVAFPVAWWMMSKWLDNYVYRTTIAWWIFALAGFVAFTIAFLTVCSKALKAAQVNPVKSLRSE